MNRTRGGLLTLLTWVLALLFVGPVLWMVLTSLHSEVNAATNPPSLFAAIDTSGWKNFFGAATGQSPWPALTNSAIASIGSTLFVLLLAFPAAYALSIRPVQKWSDVLFFFLSTKMLPLVAGLLPLYLFFDQFNLLDNISVLLLLYTVMNLPIAVWMLRSFLAEVPIEIVEASQIDGASLTSTMRYIVAPVAMPGIAATALICFIFSWNELLFAAVLTGIRAETAPVLLTSFVTSQGLFFAQLCAASVAVSIPVLAAGFAAQDKLVQGLSLGAVK